MVVTTPDRRRELEDGAWLPADVPRSGAGGDGPSSMAGSGARTPSRSGFEALERAVPDPTATASSSSMTAPGRSCPAALVAAVVEAAARHGAAIPVVPVAETLKRIDGDLVAGPSIAPGSPPHRPRRACGAGSCGRVRSRSPAARSRHLDR